MTDDSAKLFGTYAEHTRILRLWLAAYGVGGPALILSNDTIFGRISASGEGRSIAILFAISVLSQVLIALVNKIAIWGVYYGEDHESYKATRRYKVAKWLSSQFWLDVGADLISIVALAWATNDVFSIVFGAT